MQTSALNPFLKEDSATAPPCRAGSRCEMQDQGRRVRPRGGEYARSKEYSPPCGGRDFRDRLGPGLASCALGSGTVGGSKRTAKRSDGKKA